MRLVDSPLKGKKWRMIFDDGTHTDFGATGYLSYPDHKDPVRKELYLDRHRKNENWNDPKSAGALSRWILWNLPTIEASFKDYKRRFPNV
jgi:hypothetical protein